MENEVFLSPSTKTKSVPMGRFSLSKSIILILRFVRQHRIK